MFPRSFKATMKQNLLPHRLHIPLDLSLLHCPTTERWSVCGWMKGFQINHTKWWNTAVEFLVDEINVVKKVKCYMVQKSGQWLYTAHEWILRVCRYRRVSKGTGGPWNITAIYAQTGVRWSAYSRASKSQNMIHLKTRTARNERSYPTFAKRRNSSNDLAENGGNKGTYTT